MNNLLILTTYDQILQFRDYIRAEKEYVKSICAFDTESNSKRPHIAKVIGYSVSLYDNEGFYIPFLTWTDEGGLCTEAPNTIPKEGQNHSEQLHECLSPAAKKLALEILEELKEWQMIMHNATYDVIIVRRNFGIDYLPNLLCDTIMKKHTINSDKPHGLKDCGIMYVGTDAKDEQADLGESVVRNGGKWNKSDKWIWRGDLRYVGLYGAKDTVLTLILDRALDAHMDELGLRIFFYDDLVMPLLKTSTIPLSDLGFPIDVPYFQKCKLDLQAQIRDLEMQIHTEIKDDIFDMEQAVLDRDYPIRPGGRFGQALIEHVGLDIPMNPVTGNFSTAAKVITAWKPQALKHANEDQIKVIWYITGECDKVPKEMFNELQRKLFDEDNLDSISPVNLNSAAQFAEVVYKKWKITSPQTSKKTGAASFTAAVIEKLAIDRLKEHFDINEADASEKFDDLMEMAKLPTDADWFIKYLRVRKLDKLLVNYVELILELQIDGVIYTDLLQFGTTSGRYSSSNPNCFSMDTEVLTDKGWLTYANWQEEAKVASYNKDSSAVEFESPKKIWMSDIEQKSMVHLKNTHIDTKVTDNHRMLVFNRKTGDSKVIPANKLKSRSDYLIKHGAEHNGDLHIAEDLLKFYIAFQADGTYSSKNTLRFTFKKDRKASRLVDILDSLGWGYKHSFRTRHEIYVYGQSKHMLNILGKDKILPMEWTQLTSDLKKLFISELMEWDDSYTRKNNYASAVERNADTVQAIASLCGYRAHKRVYVSKKGSISHQIDITYRNQSNTSNVKRLDIIEINTVWCLEVSTGFVIARRGSDTIIIGQCQNLPSHSELGKIIKRGFIAESK